MTKDSVLLNSSCSSQGWIPISNLICISDDPFIEHSGFVSAFDCSSPAAPITAANSPASEKTKPLSVSILLSVVCAFWQLVGFHLKSGTLLFFILIYNMTMNVQL